MRAIYHALFITCSFAAVVGCRPGARQSPGAQERVSQSETHSSSLDTGRAPAPPAPIPATSPHSGANPWIESTDSGPVIHLPPVMTQALAQRFPDFRIWRWAAYPSEVRARYHGSDRDGIRAVVGDFNGDGRLDVALDGSDRLVFPSGAGAAIVAVTALLTSGDDAVAVRVTEGSLVPGDSADVPRPRWLLLVAASTFRSGLATDAVGMPMAREGGRVLTPSQVYFWSGDRPYFVQWSDGE